MRIPIVLFFWLTFLSGSAGPAIPEETARKQPPAKTAVKITVSKETTYLLGPLMADGTVDYAAALNARFGQGVTPENNAAIPLIRALGPNVLSKDSREEILQRLGTPALPEKGDYWDRRGPIPGELEKALVAPWSESDYPSVAAWLKANERSLALVIEATERSRFWIPLPEGKPRSLVPDPLPLLELSTIERALAARAMRRLHSGEASAAWADLQAGHRLARLLAVRPNSVEWLIGSAIDRIASEGVVALAKSGRITAIQAKTFLSDLRALPPFWSAFETIDQFERLTALRVLVAFAGAPESDWKRIGALLDAPGLAGLSASEANWDETLRTVNQCFDHYVALRHMPTFTERQRAAGAWAKELEDAKKRARRALRPDRLKKLLRTAQDQALARSTVGRAIGTLVCPDYFFEIGIGKPEQTEAWFRMSQVALGLAAYRAENGSFPVRLGDLNPGYLPEILRDPFTDQPLSYQRRGSGYLLYSVGPDRKADRAAGAQTGDDIVVQVD